MRVPRNRERCGLPRDGCGEFACCGRRTFGLLRFEAVGEYRIERTGLEFSFLTGFPGDLNRFLIERIDLNDNQARLYFMRADCRFQLTVSQSVSLDGQWIPLPLAPVPPGNPRPSRS